MCPTQEDAGLVVRVCPWKTKGFLSAYSGHVSPAISTLWIPHQ